MCVTGCNVIESATHLFLHCNTFSALWSYVQTWLGIYSVFPGELRRHFIHFTRMSGLPRLVHLFLTVIWFATIWVTWKEHNDRVFQNTTTTSSILLEKVKLNSFLWLKPNQTTLAYTYYDWWKHPLHYMGVFL